MGMDAFFLGLNGQRVNLTAHLHPASRFRIRFDISSVLPYASVVWCIIKYRDSVYFV